MAITSGNDNIAIKHQAARQAQDAQAAQAKQASTAEKNEAVNAFQEAWGEVNKNESNTLTGAIAEGAKDIWGALGATSEAGLEILEDATTQVLASMGNGLYDAGDWLVEQAEKGLNVADNIVDGAIEAGKYVLDPVTDTIGDAIEAAADFASDAAEATGKWFGGLFGAFEEGTVKDEKEA